MQQEDVPFVGWRQLDDFKCNALFSDVLSRLDTGVALVNKGQHNRLASDRLDLLSQLGHLSAVLAIGRSDQEGQQMSQGINDQMCPKRIEDLHVL